MEMSNKQVGPWLLKLLDVPANNCFRAVIKIEPKSVVITAEYRPDRVVDSETGELQVLLRRYTLVEL